MAISVAGAWRCPRVSLGPVSQGPPSPLLCSLLSSGREEGVTGFPAILALGHDAVGWGCTTGDNLMVGHLASHTKSLQPVIVYHAVYLAHSTVYLPLVEGAPLGCPGDF